MVPLQGTGTASVVFGGLMYFILKNSWVFFTILFPGFVGEWLGHLLRMILGQKKEYEKILIKIMIKYADARSPFRFIFSFIFDFQNIYFSTQIFLKSSSFLRTGVFILPFTN